MEVTIITVFTDNDWAIRKRVETNKTWISHICTSTWAQKQSLDWPAYHRAPDDRSYRCIACDTKAPDKLVGLCTLYKWEP